MATIKYCINCALKTPGEGADLSPFQTAEATRARNFHKSFHEYEPTPLVSLPNLAAHLGIGSLHVKDESFRFGLNAFKVLGGSYAIGNILAQRLNRSIESLCRDELCSDALRRELGNLTFATATDGNHGRGVAWTAQQLKQRAVIFMPEGSAEIRAGNIRATGAQCEIKRLNYDQTVRFTHEAARENGWLMVQDTATTEYEDIPRWIMQGYMTLAAEIFEQLQATNQKPPTHLFLQAGVGSFASAVLGFFAAKLEESTPVTVIVEPHAANCIYTSISKADGTPHNITGSLQTLMAGLACGEPSSISWGVLRDYTHMSISCPDYIAANGMRILGFPLGDDKRVISGESGAVTTGILEYIMRESSDAGIRLALGLNSTSRVLVISTEGATSPLTYQNVIWRGAHPDEV